MILGVWTGAGDSLQPELFFNQLDEGVLDFRVTGDGGFAAVAWIHVYIMTGAVAKEIAASFNQRPHEFTALHKSTPSSRVWDPECSGAGSDSSILR